MWSFATGVLASIALSGAMLWAMLAGTITIPERINNVSVLLDGIWTHQSPAGMSIPQATEGGLEE